MQKIPRFFLQETEICAILAYIFLNLVAMATPSVPLKIVIAYGNSNAPKSPLYNAIRTDESNFWTTFGCHGNHPDPHEILYTILEFADPKNLLIICPIAIAYSMGQIIQSVCVCVSVRLLALSRSHFLIDFHQNWHRRKNPEK